MATNVLPAVHLVLGAGGALEIAHFDLLIAKQTSRSAAMGGLPPRAITVRRAAQSAVNSKLFKIIWSDGHNRPPRTLLPEQWNKK